MTVLSAAERDFYTAQSPFSDPGAAAAAYQGLPADPGRLARLVRDLLIHRLEGPLFGLELAEERLREDAETRYLDEVLALVLERDGAALDVQRPPGDRFVGVCRDFALLLCSLLRHAGVPARTRCGFADYFHGGEFHADHVVTEYWDERRGWLLADAQLTDPALAARVGADVDPLDVPRDRFLVAGAAWRAIRAGEADAGRFGLAPEGPLRGTWFVAGEVRLDLAALNRSEMLQWDVWGTGADSDAELAEADRLLYDEVARVTGGRRPVFGALREVYADQRLRVPRTVLSLAPYAGVREVTLRG
ncbi:transglutaminase family protein [Streptomyces sp. NPDC007088]|uniref:transglutaminase-like domain-containing protein n=1 Tax=Streptomyces sp. NPDC007088 TaxID=3364773 RepID=UPI0036C85E30